MQRRTLKHILRLLTIAVMTTVASLGSLIVFALLFTSKPSRRTQAWWWHFRHGNSVVYDNYTIPVLANWVVVQFRGEPLELERLYPPFGMLAQLGHGFGPFISVTREKEIRDLHQWEASFGSAAFKNVGCDVESHRTIRSNGQEISCVLLGRLGWHCRGHDIRIDLETLWTPSKDPDDPKMKELWDIVSGIRRKT